MTNRIHLFIINDRGQRVYLCNQAFLNKQKKSVDIEDLDTVTCYNCLEIIRIKLETAQKVREAIIARETWGTGK